MEATIMLSKDELTRKMWDTHARECYKVIKRERKYAICSHAGCTQRLLLLSKIGRWKNNISNDTPCMHQTQKKATQMQIITNQDRLADMQNELMVSTGE